MKRLARSLARSLRRLARMLVTLFGPRLSLAAARAVATGWGFA